jgi:hypothetical protein
MSPYQQAVTDVAKNAAIREAQIAGQQANLGAARQGTYGGARQTLAGTERERNLLANLSNIQAQGSQQAYDRALAQQQFGANLGLQGIQTGLQGIQTGMQGVGQGLQGVGAQQAGFAGAEPQEAYPNHINLRGFTGLNTVEPNKEYKLILKFLVGKRPGGYYDVGDDELETKPEQKIDNKTTDKTNKASTAATKQDLGSEPEKKVENKIEEPVSAEWEATDIDTAHKVKTFITDVQAQLEDMWKKGKNPIVEDIEMTIVKNSDGSYKTKTSATITESQDGKAWVGIESRGSAGGDYQNRANDQYYGGRYDDKGRPVIDKKTGKQLNKGQSEKKADGTDNPCYGKSLIDCMKLPAIGGDEVKLLKTVEDASVPFKQYFVIFTKPKKFPAR